MPLGNIDVYVNVNVDGCKNEYEYVDRLMNTLPSTSMLRKRCWVRVCSCRCACEKTLRGNIDDNIAEYVNGNIYGYVNRHVYGYVNDHRGSISNLLFLSDG
jgi:hypothetical protein